jgi:hypothetical protein
MVLVGHKVEEVTEVLAIAQVLQEVAANHRLRGPKDHETSRVLGVKEVSLLTRAANASHGQENHPLLKSRLSTCYLF